MDIAAMNALLDAGYGTTAAAGIPTSHDLALFYGDPKFGGVEITGGGYARVTVADSDWLAAANGEKSTRFMEFPATTDEWSSEATHWALFDGADLWDSGPLAEPLDVTGVGSGPLVRVTVRFADSIIPEED
jgi:hypothetical protein